MRHLVTSFTDQPLKVSAEFRVGVPSIPYGVDVEAVCILCDADSIAARFFSRRENEAYLALNPSDRQFGFFNCWRRKMAFIKAIGDGLYYSLDSFDVSLAPCESANILRIENTPGDECGWCLSSFNPARGFVAAIVSECREGPANFAPTSSVLNYTAMVR